MSDSEASFRVGSQPTEKPFAIDGAVSKSQRPRQNSNGDLTVLVDARNESFGSAAATVTSMFRGTIQRFQLRVLVSPETETAGCLADWLLHEPDAELIYSVDELVVGDGYLLIVPAGSIVGTFSLEAALEACSATNAGVLRVLVDGSQQTLELWNTERLAGKDMRLAEESARRAGAERWISGASIGVHRESRPAPKQYLRKGAAGRFEVHVVVRDTAQVQVRQDYERHIRELQGSLDRARRELWASDRPRRGATALVRRAIGKGPGYGFKRLVRRVQTAAAGRK